MIVHQDDFIRIDWNESKMFNVLFAIGPYGTFREVDCFEVSDPVNEETAIRMAKEHVRECEEILDGDKK